MPAAAATRIFGTPAMTWPIAAGRTSCTAAASNRGPCTASHPSANPSSPAARISRVRWPHDAIYSRPAFIRIRVTPGQSIVVEHQQVPGRPPAHGVTGRHLERGQRPGRPEGAAALVGGVGLQAGVQDVRGQDPSRDDPAVAALPGGHRLGVLRDPRARQRGRAGWRAHLRGTLKKFRIEP